jgi:branched-chain amino acid transport system permease protein
MITLSDITRYSGRLVPPQIAIFSLLLLSAPFWLAPIGLYQYIGIEVVIWIIYALGFNLLFGYTGLHSFGHGAYLGVGAYAFGLFQQNVAVNLLAGWLASTFAAGLAGALVGLFVSHRRGIYYALMTIAFGQIFWFSSIKLHWLTGGEDGLLNIPRPPIGPLDLNDNVALYYLASILLIVTAIFMWRLVHSPFGRILQAVRQNEMRAAFAGYDVWQVKWLAFVISTVFAGLAGGLLAMAQESAFPDVMGVHQSGLIVMMVLVGGGLVGFWGPVYGVVLYFVARDILGALTETWLLWYGLMFVIMVMFRPEGIAGMIFLAARRISPHLASSRAVASE